MLSTVSVRVWLRNFCSKPLKIAHLKQPGQIYLNLWFKAKYFDRKDQDKNIF